LDTIIKAKKGNKKAIKQIVKENIIQVYRLIFLHTKYEEDAKNILRDTIDFIYENFSKVDNEKIILWMYKIAIINTNNFLKCNGMVEKNNSLNSYYYNNKIKMYESIDLLDLKYRNVVILKCYFDLSYDEIGYILDLNSDTVKIYFRQSLKNLKVNVGEGL
jgi:RNA polymerase sigma-70 factor (ECF subfamily)